MGSWSGVRAARRVPNEATQRRANVLAERLIQCERFLAGGSGRVYAFQEDTLQRMAEIGFGDVGRRGVERLIVTLGTNAVSEDWVRGYHATLKQRLAKIIRCKPTEIEATPDGVRQRAKK